MCDHENREAAMTVIEPGVWCDPCLEPLIRALNGGGLQTLASCCGHGKPGWVMLADGSALTISPDARWFYTVCDLVADAARDGLPSRHLRNVDGRWDRDRADLLDRAALAQPDDRNAT